MHDTLPDLCNYIHERVDREACGRARVVQKEASYFTFQRTPGDADSDGGYLSSCRSSLDNSVTLDSLVSGYSSSCRDTTSAPLPSSVSEQLPEPSNRISAPGQAGRTAPIKMPSYSLARLSVPVRSMAMPGASVGKSLGTGGASCNMGAGPFSPGRSPPMMGGSMMSEISSYFTSLHHN